MKCDIILAGVGGQGILTIATILGAAALKEGMYIKQAEVHGMSQRGGDVQSNLRLSTEPIASDLIPLGGADIIVSLEPMEALRYIQYLSPEGWIVTNTTPTVNIPNYPELEKVIAEIKAWPRSIALDMDKIATEQGSPRSSNMALLGAASPLIDIDSSKIVDAISAAFARKGEKIVDANCKAYDAGRSAALDIINNLK